MPRHTPTAAPTDRAPAALAVLAVLGALSACSEGDAPPAPACEDASNAATQWDTGGAEAADPVCDAWAKPDSLVKIKDPLVDEISGIAVSRQHEDIVWVHNDSGGGARVYALDTQARVRLVIKLKDGHPHDWEDIAMGPCAPQQPAVLWRCLYVADTGDNNKKYDSARIFRVPEPETIPPPAEGTPTRVELSPEQWQSWTFHWPDGPRNVEAMGMLADMRAILLTKSSKHPRTEVWRVDLRTLGDPFAERVGSLDVSTPQAQKGSAVSVTAADLDPTGSKLLVRTYKKLFLFETGGGLAGPATGEDALADAARAIVPNGYDAMGEAVAWDPVAGYWHTSEDTKDSTPRLWRVRCAGD